MNTNFIKGTLLIVLALVFGMASYDLFKTLSPKKTTQAQVEAFVGPAPASTVVATPPVLIPTDIKVVETQVLQKERTIQPSTAKKKLKVLTVDFDRTVSLVGEVDEGTDLIIKQIAAFNESSTTEPIYLFIDSPGGSVFSGSFLLSAMEGSKAPIYTVCTKLCASMAAVIHAYGTKRFMLDRAMLMFHPASGRAGGEVDKMVSFLKSVQLYVDKQMAYIAKRANVSFEQLKNKSQVELWIDAEDSLAMGLTDQIVYIANPDTRQFVILPGLMQQNATPKVDHNNDLRNIIWK